jgi:hypothetical protein
VFQPDGLGGDAHGYAFNYLLERFEVLAQALGIANRFFQRGGHRQRFVVVFILVLELKSSNVIDIFSFFKRKKSI